MGAKWRLRLHFLPAVLKALREKAGPQGESSCDFFPGEWLFPPGEVMPQARPGPASVREEELSHGHRIWDHLVQYASDTDRETEVPERKNWSQSWGQAWVKAQVSSTQDLTLTLGGSLREF